MARCKSCGAEIHWVSTENGKKIPVDGDYINVHPNQPGDKGTAVIVTDDGRVIRGTQVGDAFEDGYEIGRTSHFATCPDADKHRRSR